MVMLEQVTWSVCTLQEKVESGIPAMKPHVQNTPVLVLPGMNTVLIHLKCGIVAMGKSSKSTLMRNSWETQSTTKMTSCCSTSETWTGLQQMIVTNIMIAPVTFVLLPTTNMTHVMKTCTGYGRNELHREDHDFDAEPKCACIAFISLDVNTCINSITSCGSTQHYQTNNLLFPSLKALFLLSLLPSLLTPPLLPPLPPVPPPSSPVKLAPGDQQTSYLLPWHDKWY